MSFDCCTMMRVVSVSRQEWEIAEPDRFGLKIPAEWREPLVEFKPDLRIYCIANVAIAFCPWCAAPLPEYSR
jgi:hypothetical protein